MERGKLDVYFCCTFLQSLLAKCIKRKRCLQSGGHLVLLLVQNDLRWDFKCIRNTWLWCGAKKKSAIPDSCLLNLLLIPVLAAGHRWLFPVPFGLFLYKTAWLVLSSSPYSAHNVGKGLLPFASLQQYFTFWEHRLSKTRGRFIYEPGRPQSAPAALCFLRLSSVRFEMQHAKAARPQLEYFVQQHSLGQKDYFTSCWFHVWVSASQVWCLPPWEQQGTGWVLASLWSSIIPPFSLLITQ